MNRRPCARRRSGRSAWLMRIMPSERKSALPDTNKAERAAGPRAGVFYDDIETGEDLGDFRGEHCDARFRSDVAIPGKATDELARPGQRHAVQVAQDEVRTTLGERAGAGEARAVAGAGYQYARPVG